MRTIKVREHVRKKTSSQLKKAMSFEDMLPIRVKAHNRKIIRK